MPIPLADRRGVETVAAGRRRGLYLPFHLEHPDLLECTKPVRAGMINREPFHEDASPKNGGKHCDRPQSMSRNFHQRHPPQLAHDVSGAIRVPNLISFSISRIKPTLGVAQIHMRAQLARGTPCHREVYQTQPKRWLQAAAMWAWNFQEPVPGPR